MKRLAMAMLVGLASFACGEATWVRLCGRAEANPFSKQCIDYTNAREVRADERAGKLTKTDKRWLDIDRDGRFCEEPDAEWKGEPVRPEWLRGGGETLFIVVRGIGLLRSSHTRRSKKFGASMVL